MNLTENENRNKEIYDVQTPDDSRENYIEVTTMFDKELLYKNAIRSIEDGVIDIKEYNRNEAGIKNLYSGLLLLYKYYISIFDEALIFTDSKYKWQEDGSYKIIIDKPGKTINVKEIFDTFDIIEKGNYFERRILGKEFEVLEKIDGEIFKIIVSNMREIFLLSPKDLNYPKGVISEKIKQMREIIIKIDKKEIVQEDGDIEIFNLISEDFGIQEILLKNIVKIIKKADDIEVIRNYLEKIQNSENNKIKKLFEKLKDRRNSLEHHYLKNIEDLNQMVISDIENYKLIIWDFLKNYLAKNPSNELNSKVIKYFAENEELKIKLSWEKYGIIKDEIFKSTTLPTQIIIDDLLECPFCKQVVIYDLNNKKIFCEKCNKEFSYEIFVSELNKNNIIDIDLSWIEPDRFDDDIYIYKEDLECPECKKRDSLFFLHQLDNIICNECKNQFIMEDLLLNKGYNRCLAETASPDYIDFYNKGIQCDKICEKEMCTEHNGKDDWEGRFKKVRK